MPKLLPKFPQFLCNPITLACVQSDYTTCVTVLHNVNNSITHEDFMIGSAQMNIYGVTSEGNEEEIFLNGNWAF